MKLLETYEVGNTLGEGILWDDQTQAAWWTDIEERNLYRLDWQTRAIEVFDTPERLGSFGLTNVAGCLVAAFETGFALYWPTEERVEWFERPARTTPGIRFNDGRVDRQGRFWSGTMVEGSNRTLSAALYRLDTDGTVQCVEDGVRISNGLCWSPDGGTMYFADSPRQHIHAYAYDGNTGTATAKRLFATLTGEAYPDGACIAADGSMWSATWSAGHVVQYAPDGSVVANHAVPAAQPSCSAFGGPDLNLLFVTSARQGLDETALAASPLSGSLFVFDAGVSGLPEPRFPAINHINVQ
ncbi:MAG: SMP-30/gluconolactonase/LRE family protein [Alphaproteobacteria bacterium]|nr:MAG: SMP-30/gluconolactonase/LRE family protein [Alphaproteobacteria bacterium]